MRLRRANEDDLPLLVGLDQLTNPAPWLPSHFEAALRSEHSHIEWLEHKGECVGLVVWQTVCGETELHLVATHPDYRRQGLASQLLKRMLNTPSSRFFLEVRASNVGAQALYQQHGFVTMATRRGYYQGEDALIMEKTGNHHG